LNSGRLLQKNNKIMPRSVNSVAKEQEEKNNELAKGYFGRRKTFGQ
jgi:hypothetical protein